MKKIVSILILLCLGTFAQAQDNDGFYLLPKNAKLYPNKSITIGLHYASITHNDLGGAISGSALSPYVVQWTVNGKKMNALSPGDGKITPASGFDLSTVTYTAPAVAPAKNPVAIAVQVKTKDHTTLWLVCNVKIVEAQYKITMDAEQTLPIAGQDIKLHGECFANLKATVDGTYFLEPLDKTRNMQIKVEKGVFAEKDGSSQKLTAPFSYTIPFLFTIGKMDKAHPTGDATMNLYYTSPQSGQVIWKIQGNGHTVVQTIDIDNGTLAYTPGTSTQIGAPGNADKNAIAMSTVTQLNLIASVNRMDIGKTIDNTNRNISGSQDMMALAKRMQTHENAPDYFKTKQGKADLQKLMALRQKVGGNISNTSDATKKIDEKIDEKYANNPNYINSKEFHNDRRKEKSNMEEDIVEHNNQSRLAQVTPESALLRIEGKFNSESSQAFYQETKESTPGGEQATTFKIKIVKVQ